MLPVDHGRGCVPIDYMNVMMSVWEFKTAACKHHCKKNWASVLNYFYKFER